MRFEKTPRGVGESHPDGPGALVAGAPAKSTKRGPRGQRRVSAAGNQLGYPSLHPSQAHPHGDDEATSSPEAKQVPHVHRREHAACSTGTARARPAASARPHIAHIVPDGRTARRPRSAPATRRTRSSGPARRAPPFAARGPGSFSTPPQLVVHAIQLWCIERQVAAPELRLQ